MADGIKVQPSSAEYYRTVFRGVPEHLETADIEEKGFQPSSVTRMMRGNRPLPLDLVQVNQNQKHIYDIRDLLNVIQHQKTKTPNPNQPQPPQPQHHTNPNTKKHWRIKVAANAPRNAPTPGKHPAGASGTRSGMSYAGAAKSGNTSARPTEALSSPRPSKVADFYHDSSSGNQMDVVVVRIMYLEKEEEEIDLVINTDADKTLSSFCKWQEKINPKDIENPNHHDIAVLLTRYDICADAGADCGLMGLAYVAAACTSNENCAINEDGGLVLGIVVAHEMGHVMGCSHDKEGESSCAAQDKDESYFVMAPYVHVFTTKWSTCSRGFITALFENSLGDCLNDEPQTSLYAYKYALPGTIYDAEAQCDIQFPGSKLCHTDEDKFCEMLLCQTTPDSCLSDEEPPQDGTKCGKNKWCFHKKCIEVGERPEAINGGWGSYGSWSSCSRTCGGGVSISQRECDNPVPQYGGRYCLGERKKYKICNKDPCPPDQPSFREVQCTEHNEKPFNGKLHTWTPQFEKDEPCVLYCSNEENAYAKLEPRVKDGTSCKTGTKNRCISGVCRKVGCDFQLDSDAVEDVCGICNGDGTQCKIIEEVYKDTGARDYKKVATIPQGSRNVDIKELAPSVNTLAISDKSEKVFYLNGNHIEDRDGDKKFGKVEGVYAHPEPGRETLVISGPITEDLIFFVSMHSNT
nr:A disintegrin and metalloproteinase with thrombospondin motifs 7-like [Leptinotarsa decemlineata]